ncbi:MAG: SDR family oxidoreductase [Caldilineaceae bacterium]|nr:SDR family oxidoreductase [Caldilineaceae bacterium]
MSKIRGKVAWVTGASSGIGEALVRALAAAGARLVLSARRVEALERVRTACNNADQHLVLPFDLLDFDAAAVTQQALDQMGQIDLLIHCGGVSQRGTVIETDLAVDRRIMEINYFSTVALTKAVLPSMIARQAGHLVVISSLSGKISTPRRSAYAASKHALHGFFESLRTEVINEQIHITMICPGYVKTNLSRHALTGDGGAHGELDPTQAKGMAPAALATRILQAIERNEDEILVGGTEVLGVYLNRFVPGLYKKIIRRRKIT